MLMGLMRQFRVGNLSNLTEPGIRIILRRHNEESKNSPQIMTSFLLKMTALEEIEAFSFTTLPGLHPRKYVFMIKPQNL